MLALLLAAAVIAVLVVVVQIRGDERRLTEYLNLTREVAESYRTAGSGVASIVTGLESQERQALLAAVREAVAEAVTADERLAAEEPPRLAGRAGGFLAVASLSWRGGLVLLNAATDSLLDNPADVEAIARLEAAFESFAVGDRAYLGFQSEVETLGEEVEARNHPDVRFIAAGQETLYDATLFAARIAAMQELVAMHDVAVSDVRFVPAPVGDQEGIPLVPFSDVFEVQITVANRGNEPETNVVVIVQLLQMADTGATNLIQEESATVESLDPGEATSLIFDTLQVEPGSLHEVVVLAVLDGDEDLSSNEVRQVFVRSLPA